MCEIITDKKAIQELVYTFFALNSQSRLERVLKIFSKRKGFGVEFVGFLFSNEIDESFQAYGVLKDNQVLFSIDYPAASEDCEAYLSFEEFYNHIEIAINRVIKDDHEKYDELEIRKLLQDVKVGLGLSEE